jgi:acyl-CoA thioester hydrolase
MLISATFQPLISLKIMQQQFEMPVQLRWSDFDPNFHVRHSVYYDWGALCRINFLYEHGLTPAIFQQASFGPILFREEAVFRKEIRFGDTISIDMKLSKARKDYSRWTITHEIKRNDGSLCTILTVDGAWINVKERKLFTPPEIVHSVFQEILPTENFVWIDS